MSKIKLNMSIVDAITELSEGNPGAINVMVRLLREAEAIDPDSVFGASGPLMNMDSFGVYGSKIWVLFKDVCGSNLRTLILLLRSVQLGFIDRSQLKEHIRLLSPFKVTTIRDLNTQVCDTLPLFAKE